MKNVNLLLLILGFVLLVSGCVQVSDNVSQTATINVGFMAPLSGAEAVYGESILSGAQLALKESNLGNVYLVREDSKCNAKEAASAVNKLISVDDVQVIIGEVCSSATLAAAPVASENGVVMISAASTSPEISKYDGVFRTVPSDSFQGAFGAKVAAERGFEKMAILHGNEDYGIGFKNVLEREFPALGGSVVIVETFERGSVDLRTQLTKIKESGADVIYVISNSQDSSVAALKQAKELRLDIALMGSEGLKSDDLLRGAGGAAEGLILTSVTEGSEAFMQKWVAEYGESSKPGPFAAQAYDAFKAVAMTIQQGARTKDDIRQSLRTVAFEGASGYIRFDANGDVEGGYEVYVVENGSFVKE